ncbi:MBL fold metallo-hydrolase [Myxococcota bacterium]|nr:MBL fold metallo-hydrolase [Myxococcota bacterium]
MRRWVFVLAVLAIAVALVAAFRGPLAMGAMSVMAPRIMSANPMAEIPDGIQVTLCGAGSPLPDPQRSGPCVGVVAGGHLFVIDAGSASARNLQGMGLPLSDVEAVFLTHFHSDHIDGLGELSVLRWVAGAHQDPLALIGPPGVEDIAEGFNRAYRADARFRVAHHGEEVVPPSGKGLVGRPFSMPTSGQEVVVWDREGVRITAFQVDHQPVEPAVGYRIDYAGRSVVISGDTVRSPELERVAENADLLVHEALAAHLVAIMHATAKEAGMEGRAKVLNDILDYHATPVDAAESASAAGVDHLLFYHVVPPLLVPGLPAAFLQGVSAAYDGDVTLGRDGTRVLLPAGSDDIEVSGGT